MIHHEDEEDEDLVSIVQHGIDVLHLMKNAEVMDETDHIVNTKHGEHEEDEDDSDLLDEVTEVNDEHDMRSEVMVECDEDL